MAPSSPATARATPFGPSPEGYIAVVSERIDWPYLESAFEMPATVRYDAERDVVLDDANWTAVYRFAGRLAVPPP